MGLLRGCIGSCTLLMFFCAMDKNKVLQYVCGNIFCTLLMKHGVKMGHDDAPVYRGVLNLLQ